MRSLAYLQLLQYYCTVSLFY